MDAAALKIGRQSSCGRRVARCLARSGDRESRRRKPKTLLRAAVSATPGTRISSESPARREPARARWSIGWRRIIAQREETVGIIAVDPSSPYTGGAILGDRIRMQGHAGDAAFSCVRWLRAAFSADWRGRPADVALLLDAAGKQVVIIETVGVGQGEIEMVRLADCTVVVLVPGLGDEIQNMKAGLMEMADVFVLNKCDREAGPARAGIERDAFAGDAARWLASAGGAHGCQRE